MTPSLDMRAAFIEHERGVYAAAHSVLGDVAKAQDVVQDVFLRLWRRPEAFDPARGELGPYLRLMARSRALDLWRESQVRVRAAERLEHVTLPQVEEHAWERDHDGAEVRAALGELPATQREALVLAYWGGLSADQISRHTRVPLGTAKSRIRLGLARLRTTLCEPSPRAADALH
jgi:RNA polymerase sigma-70 factor, ECF subfamily